MTSTVKNFNLRVYGLLVHDKAVLITEEHRGGMQMLKFPGGGLEKGEGLADGLIREFDEELGISIEVRDFYYVNDFLQISAFNPLDQLLSFYYMVFTSQTTEIPVSEGRELKPGQQIFRWVPLDELKEEMFSFPIDKIVSQKLKG